MTLPPAELHSLEPVDAARLGALSALVRRLRETVRYVDYRQAERDCEHLASRLVEAYSRSELAGFTASAIPRGGLIVLGMLSYFLDLRPEQLIAGDDPARPHLLVDDCAVSGTRFRGVLAGTPSHRVVFAQLYSHPELRAAIVAAESRVERCLAAADLTDHAPRLHGDEYRGWIEGWRERLGPESYWLGLPDLICFAWSEPDRLSWNPISEEIEKGWQFFPPHRCLKARAELGPPPVEVATPVWRVSEAVVSVRTAGRIWLHCGETDRVYSLEGTGAEMWRVLAAWGSIEAGAAHLAGEYEVPIEQLRADLEEFGRRLVERRLLEAAG